MHDCFDDSTLDPGPSLKRERSWTILIPSEIASFTDQLMTTKSFFSRFFRREQMELETRQPLGTLAKIAIGATGVGLGYLAYQHYKKKKAQQAQGASSQMDPSGGGGGGYSGESGNYKREWNDFQERYWDDGLEERGWDDGLEERGLFMDELD
jgi:hypothetical protein